MKRMTVMLLAALAAVYLMPLFTVGVGGGKAPEPAPAAEPVAEEPPDFDRRTTVTVLLDGAIKSMSLRDYLRGVVAAEMPASFPEEALKAQAVAARSYTLYQLRLYEDGAALPESHGGAQLCGDPAHCSGYVDVDARKGELWGADESYYEARITAAVDGTAGVTATYDGAPIAAVFHSASGPRTESALAVWGADLPYLVTAASPGGDQSPDYLGEVTVTEEAFREKMLAAHPDMDLSAPADTWFRASVRSEAGGIIDVEVGGVRVSGPWLRQQLGLNSTNFTYHPADGLLTFRTVGCGHGVGMSQYGAKALAEQGRTYDEILRWYYQGVDLTVRS